MTAADLCREFEGLYLTAYKCPAGVWTIGYGHTANVTAGLIISDLEAERLLMEDIARSRRFVRQMVTKQLTENQVEALTDFCFNLGPGNLKSSTLLKKVNADPADPTIRQEFMKWVKAGGVELPGLVRRRQAEADLYFI